MICNTIIVYFQKNNDVYTNLYFQINKWTTIGMEVHLSADDVNFIRGCMKEQHNNNSNNLKINNIIDN